MNWGGEWFAHREVHVYKGTYNTDLQFTISSSSKPYESSNVIVTIRDSNGAYYSSSVFTQEYRPVITLKNNVLMGDGDGTKDTPYKLIPPKE